MKRENPIDIWKKIHSVYLLESSFQLFFFFFLRISYLANKVFDKCVCTYDISLYKWIQPSITVKKKKKKSGIWLHLFPHLKNILSWFIFFVILISRVPSKKRIFLIKRVINKILVKCLLCYFSPHPLKVIVILALTIKNRVSN